MADVRMSEGPPPTLFGSTGPISVEALSRKDGNALLARWGHILGPCNRPFGQQQWGLVVLGEVVSVAISASTVSSTVTDEHGMVWTRPQIIELARICSAPGGGWATRPMLRLWRSVLGPQMWPHWPVSMAVSYATPGKKGDIYRFDGWRRVRTCKPSSPGKTSTWSKPSATDAIGDGRKTLWVFRYQDEVCG